MILAVVVLVVVALAAGAAGVVVLTGDDGDDDERGGTTTEQGAESTTTDGTESTDGPSSTTTTETSDSSTTTEPADDAVDQVVGSWTGTYTCVQGLTRLELDIDAGDGPGEVTATFSFSAHPSNPDVPTGSFAMAGTATEEDGLVLEPGAWIDRPGRFETVGLTAPLPSPPDRMTGTVEGASACTTFEVTRG